ncbi:MAG: glycerol-3-phosphate 1-O-acyltransferase PlsY [Acidiferrobacterales bacterium]|jgi:glycerol-3-phosphate acyltransferase PlsY|nr:glycerol-3-phosphate 1-O-acyltransferase PlsY [Acidiferrobacterales bacterium]
MASSILAVLLSYLLGSVSGSLLIGRIRGVDIRRQGSGNAGGTNAFRTQGLWFALAVVAIDVGKGAAATALLPSMAIKLFGPSSFPTDLALALACGFAAVLGHVYPVYHQFRGGKGAGTFIGVLLVTQPVFVLPVVGAWLLVLLLTGYVGLSTVLAALAFIPVVMVMANPDTLPTWMVFAVIGAGFIVFTHRSNIQRLRSGTEFCFEKARVFRRRG